MDSSKTSSFIIRSSIIAALGGLLFGFDTAVYSGTTESLTKVFHLSDWGLGFTGSSALIGTILGAATIQFPARRYGRKWTLIVIALFYFLSAVGTAFPWSWNSFLFFRFIGGLAVGGASVVSPLYTAEIAPAKTRGILVAVTQFNIVLGILLAYVSNYTIVCCNLGDSDWRWMYGVEAVPAALFFFLMFLNPESPRWLVIQNRLDEAKLVLRRLWKNIEEADAEFDMIYHSVSEEKNAKTERLFCRKYRFPIMLAIMIAMFNQLSGINVIMYYAPKVFLMTGIEKSMAMFFPMIIGLTNIVVTMLAMLVIDSFGRKKLMYVGSVGYILSMVVVGLAFLIYNAPFSASIERLEQEENAAKVAMLATESGETEKIPELKTDDQSAQTAQTAPIVDPPLTVPQAETVLASAAASVSPTSTVDTLQPPTAKDSKVPIIGVMAVLIGLMVFIASHAFGQGSVIWVFIGEIFPNSVRAQGQALGCFTHWIFAAAITQLFPPMNNLFGPSNIFFFFAAMMVLQLMWAIFIMPETKQVPLEKMQKILGISDTSSEDSAA